MGKESDIVKGNAEILKKYCENFTCLSGSCFKKYDGFGKFFEGEYKLLRFENNLQLDREKFDRTFVVYIIFSYGE